MHEKTLKNDTARVAKFKQECRNYKKYCDLENKAALKVKELETQIEGVHSPSWDKAGSSGGRKEISTLALIEEKSKWENIQRCYHELQELLDCYISSIRPPAVASYVVRECRQGESIMQIALNEDRDPKKLSTEIYAQIAYYITPKMLDRIDDIKNRISKIC